MKKTPRWYQAEACSEVIGALEAAKNVNPVAAIVTGGGKSLLDYNPAANTTTVLLGPPVNGGSVLQALPYADRK